MITVEELIVQSLYHRLVVINVKKTPDVAAVRQGAGVGTVRNPDDPGSSVDPEKSEPDGRQHEQGVQSAGGLGALFMGAFNTGSAPEGVPQHPHAPGDTLSIERTVTERDDAQANEIVKALVRASSAEHPEPAMEFTEEVQTILKTGNLQLKRALLKTSGNCTQSVPIWYYGPDVVTSLTTTPEDGEGDGGSKDICPRAPHGATAMPTIDLEQCEEFSILQIQDLRNPSRKNLVMLQTPESKATKMLKKAENQEGEMYGILSPPVENSSGSTTPINHAEPDPAGFQKTNQDASLVPPSRLSAEPASFFHDHEIDSGIWDLHGKESLHSTRTSTRESTPIVSVNSSLTEQQMDVGVARTLFPSASGGEAQSGAPLVMTRKVYSVEEDLSSAVLDSVHVATRRTEAVSPGPGCGSLESKDARQALRRHNLGEDIAEEELDGQCHQDLSPEEASENLLVPHRVQNLHQERPSPERKAECIADFVETGHQLGTTPLPAEFADQEEYLADHFEEFVEPEEIELWVPSEQALAKAQGGASRAQRLEATDQPTELQTLPEHLPSGYGNFASDLGGAPLCSSRTQSSKVKQSTPGAASQDLLLSEAVPRHSRAPRQQCSTPRRQPDGVYQSKFAQSQALMPTQTQAHSAKFDGSSGTELFGQAGLQANLQAHDRTHNGLQQRAGTGHGDQAPLERLLASGLNELHELLPEHHIEQLDIDDKMRASSEEHTAKRCGEVADPNIGRRQEMRAQLPDDEGVLQRYATPLRVQVSQPSHHSRSPSPRDAMTTTQCASQHAVLHSKQVLMPSPKLSPRSHHPGTHHWVAAHGQSGSPSHPRVGDPFSSGSECQSPDLDSNFTWDSDESMVSSLSTMSEMVQVPEFAKFPDWMGELPESLQNVPLTCLSIPGSHISMAIDRDMRADMDFSKCNYEMAEFLRKLPNLNIFNNFRSLMKRIWRAWMPKQRLNLTQQLEGGIRYLDMHVTKYHNAFYAEHGLYTKQFKKYLREVKDFCDVHPHEVVIIHFPVLDQLDKSDKRRLVTMLFQIFGARLTKVSGLHELTLSNLWRNKKQYIIIFPRADMESLRNHIFAGLIWSDEVLFQSMPKKEAVAEMISHLEEVYQEKSGTPDDNRFHLLRAVLSPDMTMVFGDYRYKSMRELTRQETNVAIGEWLLGRHHLNIVALDFVETNEVVAKVLRLNTGGRPKSLCTEV